MGGNRPGGVRRGARELEEVRGTGCASPLVVGLVCAGSGGGEFLVCGAADAACFDLVEQGVVVVGRREQRLGCFLDVLKVM